MITIGKNVDLSLSKSGHRQISSNGVSGDRVDLSWLYYRHCLKIFIAGKQSCSNYWPTFHPGVAENIAPVGDPGSHWPHPQLTTADWSHLCHTAITLCLSQGVKGTILHPSIVSRGNPFNNDITSWAPTGAIFSATPGWYEHTVQFAQLG